MLDVDVPADAPLRRPTARARRALAWAQIGLACLVVLAAIAVGGAVQARIDDHNARHAGPIRVPPSTAVLLEAAPAPPLPGVSSAPDGPGLARGTAGYPGGDHTVAVTGHDGPLAALGTLLVGWILTAAAGTVGRRRLERQEDERWAAGWAGVEPLWSGRVP